MTLYYSNATRHAQNEGLITFAATGCKFNLYNGAQPANANTAVTSQVLLASLTIPGVFGTDVNGTLTLGAITSAVASNAGTASWFRIFKSDNTTVVLDGSVGISGADLNLNSVAIAALQTVAITSGTIIRNNQ
tara:strand:+ start:1429 stop:1827 length:399 start_codon:yes stop_codon:yes gene_type:complete